MKYFDFTGSLGLRCCRLDLLLGQDPPIPGGECVYIHIYIF